MSIVDFVDKASSVRLCLQVLPLNSSDTSEMDLPRLADSVVCSTDRSMLVLIDGSGFSEMSKVV